MHLALKEICLSVFIGCIPIFLVRYCEGDEGVVSFVRSAMMADYLLYYFAFFFALHTLSSITFRIWGWLASDESKQRIKSFIEFVGAVGDGFLGVYRLITGLLLAFPFLWKQAEPEAVSVLQVSVLFSVGCIFQFGTIAIASTNEWAKSLTSR